MVHIDDRGVMKTSCTYAKRGHTDAKASGHSVRIIRHHFSGTLLRSSFYHVDLGAYFDIASQHRLGWDRVSL
jgi:hypothetical protein